MAYEGPPKSTSIYDQYNPEGEAGGLFAPPHIAGWKPAQDATEAYYKKHFPVSYGMIDELRMPQAGGSGASSTGSSGSGGMSNTINFVPEKGFADPLALKALAQGGNYDVQGRRDAIAQQVMANQQAPAPAAAAAPQPSFDDEYWRMRNYEKNSTQGGNF